jgi:hypothetical protein
MTAKPCATKTTTKPKHNPLLFIADRQPAKVGWRFSLLGANFNEREEVTKMAQVVLAKREKKAIAPTIAPDEALSEWLSEHRSENTRAAYYRDLVDFCRTVFNAEPERALRRFFSLDEVGAGIKVTQFKQMLRERGLSPASINRKLSALRAFIDHARRRGIVNWRIKDLIKGEKQRTDPKERIRLRLPATTADGLIEAFNGCFLSCQRKASRA